MGVDVNGMSMKSREEFTKDRSGFEGPGTSNPLKLDQHLLSVSIL